MNNLYKLSNSFHSPSKWAFCVLLWCVSSLPKLYLSSRISHRPLWRKDISENQKDILLGVCQCVRRMFWLRNLTDGSRKDTGLALIDSRGRCFWRSWKVVDKLGTCWAPSGSCYRCYDDLHTWTPGRSCIPYTLDIPVLSAGPLKEDLSSRQTASKKYFEILVFRRRPSVG